MKLPAQPFKNKLKAAEKSYPQNQLQKHSQNRLRDLQAHIEYLKRLTQLLTPTLNQILGNEGKWQVAAFDDDVLCIATEQHTAASQLRYLQHTVIKALQQLPDFAAIRHLKIVVEIQPEPKTVRHAPLPALTPEIKQILDEAASAFTDDDISETLRRLARTTKSR